MKWLCPKCGRPVTYPNDWDYQLDLHGRKWHKECAADILGELKDFVERAKEKHGPSLYKKRWIDRVLQWFRRAEK